MSYVPSIPEWFQTRKAAQVVAFFATKAGGSINVLKATKMVYLADRASMDQRDHPITNDTYVSMPFGPVNSYTYSYMNGVAPERRDEWFEFIAPRKGNNIILSRHVDIEEDLDELSRSDVRILGNTWEEFKDIDHFALAEWTHKFCPEWQNPGKSSIPIDSSTIFKRLGKTDPVDLAEDLHAERRIIVGLRAG